MMTRWLWQRRRFLICHEFLMSLIEWFELLVKNCSLARKTLRPFHVTAISYARRLKCQIELRISSGFMTSWCSLSHRVFIKITWFHFLIIRQFKILLCHMRLFWLRQMWQCNTLFIEFRFGPLFLCQFQNLALFINHLHFQVPRFLIQCSISGFTFIFKHWHGLNSVLILR